MAEAETEVVAKKAKKSEVARVLFTRKDGSTREFNAADHGDDFVKVADEFATTNEKFIATREDL